MKIRWEITATYGLIEFAQRRFTFQSSRFPSLMLIHQLILVSASLRISFTTLDSSSCELILRFDLQGRHFSLQLVSAGIVYVCVCMWKHLRYYQYYC